MFIFRYFNHKTPNGSPTHAYEFRFFFFSFCFRGQTKIQFAFSRKISANYTSIISDGNFELNNFHSTRVKPKPRYTLISQLNSLVYQRMCGSWRGCALPQAGWNNCSFYLDAKGILQKAERKPASPAHGRDYSAERTT